MEDPDVRDIHGRLGLIIASTVIGTAAAIVLATWLPGRGWRLASRGFAPLALIVAGAVGLSFLAHAALRAMTRRSAVEPVALRVEPMAVRVEVPRATARRIMPRAARPTR